MVANAGVGSPAPRCWLLVSVLLRVVETLAFPIVSHRSPSLVMEGMVSEPGLRLSCMFLG